MLFSSFLVTVNRYNWVPFGLRKLSVDFRHFRVFVFCHKAYSKTRKPRKTSISSFVQVLRLFIYLEHFVWSVWSLWSKNFVWSELNFQIVAQSYQGELTTEAWTGLDWIGLECFISCWQNRRKDNQINECIIQVLAHINRYVQLKSASKIMIMIIIVIILMVIIIRKINYISK